MPLTLLAVVAVVSLAALGGPVSQTSAHDESVGEAAAPAPYSQLTEGEENAQRLSEGLLLDSKCHDSLGVHQPLTKL